MLVGYIALLYCGSYYLEPQSSLPAFLAYTGAVTGILIVVVVAKGGRPIRWRWGKE